MRGRSLARASTAGLGVVLPAGCGVSPSATISTAISSPVPTDTDGNVFAQAHSPSFALGNATVSSSAFSFRSQRDVDSDPANVVGTLKGTIRLRANGRQSAMFVTIAYITGPLIEAEVDTVGGPQPVPEALVTSLVTMVAARATMG